MMVGQLSARDLAGRLAGPGLTLRTGPFCVRLKSDAAPVVDGVELLYEHYPLLAEGCFCDFELDISRQQGLRRWVRPQVRFSYDGAAVFEPMPLGHALPLLEWAMNWCISTHAHQYLLLHAAVVEREGRAAILPAPPGSGKSTLCAGLIHRGWRLLSDEMALVSLQDGRLWPLARPVSLKNQSLDVIRRFNADAVFNAPTHDTAKGTVAHMKVPREHLLRMDEPARPAWVVFPKYVAGAASSLVERPKADAMIDLTSNAFNYTVLGRAGFHTLADLVTASECFDFNYSSLEEAIGIFDSIARQPGA
jgi:HprK-related kinase A